MKQITFFLVLMLCACGLRAQYSDLYYHRVGDTIEQNPNNGYFEWWGWDESVETNQLIWYGENPFYLITLQKNHTPVPLKILGLAAVIKAGDHDNGGAWCLQTSNQEYLYLYEANPSGFHKVAEAPYNLTDGHRTLHLKYNGYTAIGSLDSCCRLYPMDTNVPLYEYYFDSAITVYDSFYVGFSNISNDRYDRYLPCYGFTLYGLLPYNIDCKGTGHTSAESCPGVNGTILCAQTPYPYSTDTIWTWFTSMSNYSLMVYPIVEMDTTLPPADMCVDVEGVRGSLSGDCLTVSWDAWPRYTNLQLRYGPITLPQSDWDTLTVTGASRTICAVDTTVSHYGVSLRAYCISAHDTTDWSPVEWIPMVQNAIDAPDAVETALAASVVLSPNPASGSVHVGSQHVLVRIEMTNARGILVYSEPFHGHEATVDLDRLPAGLYVVTVQTLNGTVAKRLVVK